MTTELEWKIGTVHVTRVEETILPVPTTALIPDFTLDHLDPHRDWLVPSFFTEAGELVLSIHTFLVRSGETVIVVDTCVGTDRADVLPGDPAFPERLGGLVEGGLDGVDVVLCTHLHFDHVGWNTRVVAGRRVATFPNARYLVSRAELEHLDTADPMEVRAEYVQPLLDAGLVDAAEADHRLTDEVRLVPTPGHSPGHVSVLIESGGEQALISGDAAHSPLQFTHPELASSPFDWDAAMSTTTRRQLVDEYADTETLVLGTHFGPPTAGHIRRADGRIWFTTQRSNP